ncbi:tetratricopeptide repeat protein 28-like [Porites lutea]|uniref:tetratricopeptide repeat protein 28-like n=1 Tax=Porites lutea TaxID=51062 RepID=UPI003CC53D62
MLTDSLDEAVAHFKFSVKTFDTIRGSFISEDAWKISFRERYISSYRYLCRVLIALQKTDEALYAAERGRAGALLDALKKKYGFTSLSPISNETEEDFAYISRNTSVLTIFIALDEEAISLWVLGKKTNAIFRQAILKSGGAHEDPFNTLLKDSLNKIGAGRDVRCENRSLDLLRDKSTSSTNKDDKISIPSHENIDWLQPLYDIVFCPIEDLLDGDELVVVPDGALCLAPWTALSETLRIRIIPSLTSLKVIRDSSSEYYSKTGALLVGDPCLKKVKNKRDKPIYDQLEFAKKEVEMIGKLLNSQPLTGEAATKGEVLRRIDSVALIHIAAHGGKEAGEIALAPNPGWQSKTLIPTEEDYMLKMSDLQATKLRARLVVLSCCHSGQGEVSSEGVVGMARAFLFAGARSVLASLWAIDDEATMLFIERFYQHLRVGESASTALQKAMKRLRDSDDFSAPKYWAPFVLIGDDVTMEFDVDR